MKYQKYQVISTQENVVLVEFNTYLALAKWAKENCECKRGREWVLNHNNKPVTFRRA